MEIAFISRGCVCVCVCVCVWLIAGELVAFDGDMYSGWERRLNADRDYNQTRERERERGCGND